MSNPLLYGVMLRFFRFAALAVSFMLLAACSSKPGMIGKTAPDFTLADPKHTLTLSQFRGRVVVLNFWATYCAPCIEDLPSLQRMAAQMKASNVVVLAISEDPDENAYHNFLQKYHIE